jgi:hypothetical protein
MINKTLFILIVKICIFFIFFIKLTHSEEVKNKNFIKSSTCGLSVSIPKVLESIGDSISPCIGSYKNKEGAVLSLIVDKFQGASPNWIDKQPILHIYNIGIDDFLSEKKSQRNNFRVMPNGLVENRYPMTNCGSPAKTNFIYLKGKNWNGWMAEDNYDEKEIDKSKEESCQEFKKINQCVRLAFGNKNISAVMNQYCLTKNYEEYDLDDRLSFKIFMEMILSIEFFEY